MASSASPLVQRFGNSEATNGGSSLQGIVYGDVHIGRDSPQRLLDSLPAASFDTPSKQHSPSCLENTRRNVLEQIERWADGDGEERIYWLKGMAGTGKSTIALTIARKYNKEGRLGASFFFSRGGGDLASAGKFAVTIAAQLADAIPQLRKHIHRAVASNRRVLDLGLYSQWEKLVIEPLAQLDKDASLRPTVIVVDALDECDNEDDIALLVQRLEDATMIESSQLRVFVTSRPESSINLSFDGISHNARRFVLHDIEDSIVEEDLRLFYKDKLMYTAKRFDLDPKMYSDETIRRLVRKSDRLFIHAATVCRFIHEGGGVLANERLLFLVAKGNTPTTPEKDLDQIYTDVLVHSWPERLEPEETTKVQTLFNRIVGSIVLLFDMMSLNDLAVIVDEPRDEINRMLQSFHSVLDIPTEEAGRIRLLHPSFRDFLLDPSRCQNPTFSVDIKTTHYLLFDNCLRLMKTYLRRNMCNLERPGIRIHDIPKANVDKCISLPIQYACRQWIRHLQLSDINPNEHDGIIEFFKTQFLYWIETLSLLRLLPEGITMSRWLEAELSAPSRTNTIHGSSLSETVHDAIRFLYKYGSIIEVAPLQIYCSALVFAPKNSIIRKLYSNQVPNWVIRRPMGPEFWSPYLQTVASPGVVHAIAFSPDSRLIVLGSANYTIRLWDAATGREHRVFNCPHFGGITAVAFSPDGRLVASGANDGTVRLWDVATGREHRVFNYPHSGWIAAVAFSPDGRLLASGASDGIIRLCDVATNERQRELKSQSSLQPINAIAFSPDGRLIASVLNKDSPSQSMFRGARAGAKENVRLFDVATGKEHATFQDHSERTIGVTFLPDGLLIALGSKPNTLRLWGIATREKKHNTLRLWDVATGEEKHKLNVKARAVPSYIAFSPDGRLLAFGSTSIFIELWDVATGKIQPLSMSHTFPVNAVAFSPNSQLLVSASRNPSMSGSSDIRLWDMNMSNKQHELNSHSSWGDINSVAYSPDDRLIGIALDDDTTRLWDISASKELCVCVFKSRSTINGLVAFSPDGRVVASSSSVETVVLWDVATGKRQHVLKCRSYVRSIAFSPDGRLLASHSSETIQVWVTATGKKQRTIKDALWLSRMIAFSPDGRLLASGDSVWDVATGEKQHNLEGSDRFWTTAAAFSPDGRSIVLGSEEGIVLVWDIATGKKLREFKGHAGSVKDIKFSPDGRLVVSRSKDNTIRLWDAVTGTEQGVYSTGTAVGPLSISSCGTYIRTNCGNLQLSSAMSHLPDSIYVSKDWIQENGEDLIYLDPDYRRRFFVSGNCVFFNYAPESILQIDTSYYKRQV
ncbi:WD40-repeat-containing domain protein [Nemania sp. FL0031]|nr:WD40-repeat-containing domain protein [Nemania sp. FL0031]